MDGMALRDPESLGFYSLPRLAERLGETSKDTGPHLTRAVVTGFYSEIFTFFYLSALPEAGQYFPEATAQRIHRSQ